MTGLAEKTVRLILEHARDSGDPDDFDLGPAWNEIARAIAVIMEAHPSMKTPRDLRASAESYGKLIHAHMKAARDYFDKTGGHMLHDAAIDFETVGSA